MCRPDRILKNVNTYRTRKKERIEPANSVSIERGVRQLLADKVSGNMLGLWLLVPEHLRLGTWDLLCHWTSQPSNQVEPRLALQLVHEAALCVAGVRQSRTLSQKGFELLNGLPFVATDQAIHDLLNAHTVEQANNLQINLGLIRRALGHFKGDTLAIDPHRLHSFSKRQMCRHRDADDSKSYKASQTFFCLDADTKQPIAFVSASSAMTASQATIPLLDLVTSVLNPQTSKRPLVLADTEHYTASLFEHVFNNTCFDLLTPMNQQKSLIKSLAAIPSNYFIPCWAGMATTHLPYSMDTCQVKPLIQIVQRSGENPEQFAFKAFLTTRYRNEVDVLSCSFPKRWHIEEFFNFDQDLGWGRAGTLNLNIRFGQMSLALIAQAAIHQLRKRLGSPADSWNAEHLAYSFFRGMDGDIRVHDDTILVTFYNAPNADLLKSHYHDLPNILSHQNIDPRIPWLFNFKLNFAFK